VGILSTEFRPQANYQAKILDADSVARVFVPHPISDQTDQQLHSKADQVFDQVIQALKFQWTPQVNESVVAPEDCSS